MQSLLFQQQQNTSNNITTRGLLIIYLIVNIGFNATLFAGHSLSINRYFELYFKRLISIRKNNNIRDNITCLSTYL